MFFQSLRFSKADIESICCILAAILHLGNMKIAKDGNGESSKMANMKPVCDVKHVCRNNF